MNSGGRVIVCRIDRITGSQQVGSIGNRGALSFQKMIVDVRTVFLVFEAQFRREAILVAFTRDGGIVVVEMQQVPQLKGFIAVGDVELATFCQIECVFEIVQRLTVAIKYTPHLFV